MAAPFVVPLGELPRHPGARMQVQRTGRLTGVSLSTSRLADEDIAVDLELEAQGSTVTATGTVTGTWEGECRRCLEETSGPLTVELSEVFAPDPVEGETYPLARDHLDLEPALREAVALALPLAPLCDDACVGPDPDDHPVHPEDEASDDEDDGPPADPRWAALDQIRFDN